MTLKTIISIGLAFVFLTQSLGPMPAYAQELKLPAPGTMVHLSSKYNPPMLKGIKVYPNEPFRFEFILDKGDVQTKDHRLQTKDLKEEANKLIKYFLASITTPEEDLWVNLSPYEKNRIIPEAFGKTEMGRDLLAQDYILKQITASLIYPEGEIGKKFWKKVYEEAAKRYGTTNIPVNTFNKVWIVPEKAVVYENMQNGLRQPGDTCLPAGRCSQTEQQNVSPSRLLSKEGLNAKAPQGNNPKPTEAIAYVVESKLKVMLEEDYLAIEKNQRQPGDMTSVVSLPVRQAGPSTLPSKKTIGGESHAYRQAGDPKEMTNRLSSQILREIIIPILEREINQGQNFAQLRQVYNSLILAQWYKRKIKGSILAKVYADRNKIEGIGYSNKLQTLNSKLETNSYLSGRQANDLMIKRPKRLNILNLERLNFVSSLGFRDLNLNPEQIYQQYLKAFKKGVYNYIKEESSVIASPTGEAIFSGKIIPRKYFSGGFNLIIGGDMMQQATPQQAQRVVQALGTDRTMRIVIDATPLLDQQISERAKPVVAPDQAMGTGEKLQLTSPKSNNRPMGRVEGISLSGLIRLLKEMYRDNNKVHFNNYSELSFNASIKGAGMILGSSAEEFWVENFKIYMGELIHNALQGRDAKNGAERVEVSVQIKDQKMIFEIRDNGPGISEEIFLTINNRIVTQQPMSSKLKGDGLGLIEAAKVFIDDMGAEMWIENKPKEKFLNASGVIIQIAFPIDYQMSAQVKPVAPDQKMAAEIQPEVSDSDQEMNARLEVEIDVPDSMLTEALIHNGPGPYVGVGKNIYHIPDEQEQSLLLQVQRQLDEAKPVVEVYIESFQWKQKLSVAHIQGRTVLYPLSWSSDGNFLAALSRALAQGEAGIEDKPLIFLPVRHLLERDGNGLMHDRMISQIKQQQLVYINYSISSIFYMLNQEPRLRNSSSGFPLTQFLLEKALYDTRTIERLRVLVEQHGLDWQMYRSILNEQDIIQGQLSANMAMRVTGKTFWTKDLPMIWMVKRSIGNQIQSGDDVLEIGTGPGILTKSIAEQVVRRGLSNVQMVATDIEEDAIKDARRNLRQYSFVEVREPGDLFKPLHLGETFKIIIWNPPWYRSRNGGVKKDDPGWVDPPEHKKLHEFLEQADQYSPEGKVYIIFPQDREYWIIEMAEELGWQMQKVDQYQTRERRVGLYELIKDRQMSAQAKPVVVSDQQMDAVDIVKAMQDMWWHKPGLWMSDQDKKVLLDEMPKLISELKQSISPQRVQDKRLYHVMFAGRRADVGSQKIIERFKSKGDGFDWEVMPEVYMSGKSIWTYENPKRQSLEIQANGNFLTFEQFNTMQQAIERHFNLHNLSSIKKALLDKMPYDPKIIWGYMFDLTSYLLGIDLVEQSRVGGIILIKNPKAISNISIHKDGEMAAEIKATHTVDQQVAASQVAIDLQKLSYDFLTKYTLETEGDYKEKIAERVRTSHHWDAADPQGYRVLKDFKGKKVIEISSFNVIRYFDLQGRWIMTVDPLNATKQLYWNDQGQFERGVFKIPTGRTIQVRRAYQGTEILMEDGVTPLFSTPYYIFDAPWNISEGYIQSTDKSYRGHTLIVLSVMAQLCKDQNKQMKYSIIRNDSGFLDYLRIIGFQRANDSFDPSPFETIFHLDGTVVSVARRKVQTQEEFVPIWYKEAGGEFNYSSEIDRDRRTGIFSRSDGNFELVLDGQIQKIINLRGEEISVSQDSEMSAQVKPAVASDHQMVAKVEMVQLSGFSDLIKLFPEHAHILQKMFNKNVINEEGLMEIYNNSKEIFIEMLSLIKSNEDAFFDQWQVLRGKDYLGEEALGVALRTHPVDALKAVMLIRQNDFFFDLYESLTDQNYLRIEVLREAFQINPLSFTSGLIEIRDRTRIQAGWSLIVNLDPINGRAFLRQAFIHSPNELLLLLKEFNSVDPINFWNQEALVEFSTPDLRRSFMNDSLDFLKAVSEIMKNSDHFKKVYSKLKSTGIGNKLQKAFIEMPFTLVKTFNGLSNDQVDIICEHILEHGINLSKFLRNQKIRVVLNNDNVASTNSSKGLIKILGLDREGVVIGYTKQLESSPEYVQARFEGYQITDEPVTSSDHIVIKYNLGVKFDPQGNENELPYMPFKIHFNDNRRSGDSLAQRQAKGMDGHKKVIIVSSITDVQQLRKILLGYQQFETSARPLLFLATRNPDSQGIFRNFMESQGYRVAERNHPSDSFLEYESKDIIIINTRGELSNLAQIADGWIVTHDRDLFDPASKGIYSLYEDGYWGNNRASARLLSGKGISEKIHSDPIEFYNQIRRMISNSQDVYVGLRQAKEEFEKEIVPAAELSGALAIMSMVLNHKKNFRKSLVAVVEAVNQERVDLINNFLQREEYVIDFLVKVGILQMTGSSSVCSLMPYARERIFDIIAALKLFESSSENLEILEKSIFQILGKHSPAYQTPLQRFRKVVSKMRSMEYQEEIWSFAERNLDPDSGRIRILPMINDLIEYTRMSQKEAIEFLNQIIKSGDMDIVIRAEGLVKVVVEGNDSDIFMDHMMKVGSVRSDILGQSMRAKIEKGGVDLTSDKALQIKSQGQEIAFHVDDAMLSQLQNAPGFYPKIIAIESLDDLSGFLGLPSAEVYSVR